MVKNSTRLSSQRKTGGLQDDYIMKELEDYVNEKKQTNKYLDDISDFDTHSNNKSKQRLSKKQKDQKNSNEQVNF